MRRRGFTLVELIVVIGILLALTVLVIAVYNANSGSDKMRSAARIAQSAVMGSRDRALHAGERRGFRLTLDPQDANIGTGFVYLQPLPLVAYGTTPGSLAVCRQPETGAQDYDGIDAGDDNPSWLVLTGAEAQDLFALDSQGLLPLLGTTVRIPADGQKYTPVVLNASAPYYVTMNGGFAVVQLTSAVVTSNQGMPNVQSIPFGASNATAEFDLGNELLPHHTAIPLPSGIVIDIPRSSANLALYRDVMFSPRGSIEGPLAALGPLHLILRDIRDVTEGNNPAWVGAENPGNVNEQQPKHETLILTIFPQTGHVAAFQLDLTDSNNDGTADDVFRFARTGNKAGN